LVADDAVDLYRINQTTLEGRCPVLLQNLLEVRGIGLLMGLKCAVPNTDVVKAAYAQHLLTVPAADNVLRLLPALNIEDADITEALARLDRAATALTSQ
jgi:acetylornithine/N-succinyldiaminopimelate aminotransferase